MIVNGVIECVPLYSFRRLDDIKHEWIPSEELLVLGFLVIKSEEEEVQGQFANQGKPSYKFSTFTLYFTYLILLQSFALLHYTM